MTGPIGIIVNPCSRKNKGRPDRAAALRRALGPHGAVRETQAPGDVRSAVEDLLARGARIFVSDGGDGSLHWLLNGLRAALGPGEPLPIVLPTGGGTIDFAAAKAGVRGAPDRVVERLVSAVARGDTIESVALPSLELRSTRVAEGGREVPFERLGFLAALGGMACRYFEEYARAPDGVPAGLRIVARTLGSAALAGAGLARLPGVPLAWAAYGAHMLRADAARVHVDGRELAGREWRLLAAGAFPCAIGGVLRVFPLARDGKLHIVAGNPGALETALGLRALLLGGAIGGGVLEAAAGAFGVEALGAEPLRPVADGEPLGPVRAVEARPGPAVRIVRIAPMGAERG